MTTLRSRLRLALVVVLLVAGSSGLLSSAHEASTPVFQSGSCTAPALSVPFTSPVSMQSFGCSQGWAYSWATVGSGPHAIGVTELLHLNPATNTWTFASRADYCAPNVATEPSRYLPQDIYEKACFSN